MKLRNRYRWNPERWFPESVYEGDDGRSEIGSCRDIYSSIHGCYVSTGIYFLVGESVGSDGIGIDRSREGK